MKEAAGNKLPGRARRVSMARTSMAIAASSIMAAGVVHANPSNNTVLVPPADLPALARQGGEAMLLNDAVDGRTLLYVEQNQGAQLAIFDVTDPSRIKGEGSVQLDAAGPFDFVSPLGNQAELVRYRQGDKDAVLNLHKEKTPVLEPVPEQITRPGSDGLAVNTQTALTKADTGTTFLLTEKGLYVLRRPAVETVH